VILPQSFYARDALLVAHDLVGCLLVHDDVTLRITEVEAYRWTPDRPDTANHCRMGRTARNAPMWGPPGHAYVYLCYGLHWMLNLVTDRQDEGAAVLIRGAEVVRGEAIVRARRNGGDLVGPGKVAAGLGLDRSFNEHPLFMAGGLEVHAHDVRPRLVVGPRIGVDYADPVDRDAPWRVADAGSRSVARRRGLSNIDDGVVDAPSPPQRH
jgi:DNA-3-methyladenine glycosylase